MELNFEILFTVEILHRYYQDEICPDFLIIPSENTRAILNGHDLVCKQFENTLYVGVQTVTAGTPAKPLIELDENIQLTFFLKCRNPLFNNYTNLPQVAGQSQLLYFSNTVNNISNGKNFLSTPNASYTSTINYTPGDIIVGEDITVYESISENPAPAKDITETGYWRAIDKNRYVSSGDFYTPDTNSPIAKEIKTNMICAVIDIVNTASVPEGYKLLADDGTLLKPVYSIYFLNRSTRWKYYFRDASDKLIVDTNGVLSDRYGFTKISSNIISDLPIPLNDKPLKLSLQKKVSGGVQEIVKPIPCASIKNIARSTNTSDPFFYSEIYLNY